MSLPSSENSLRKPLSVRKRFKRMISSTLTICLPREMQLGTQRCLNKINLLKHKRHFKKYSILHQLKLPLNPIPSLTLTSHWSHRNLAFNSRVLSRTTLRLWKAYIPCQPSHFLRPINKSNSNNNSLNQHSNLSYKLKPRCQAITNTLLAWILAIPIIIWLLAICL